MERTLAVLIDFENIATGCEKEGLGRFDVRIVMRRLKDKGRILVSRSYADWGRWSRFKLDLVHEGVQMCELTSHGMQSKNRADIALAVDAMELAYTRTYIDTFVILSGDSDFTPLVLRLKELNKRVIGCGTRRSTSRLIAETCDEFFFYDTLRDESRIAPAKKRPAADEEEEEEVLTLDEALELLGETLENLQRDEAGAVHASVLKASMKRKEPTFSEGELGIRTFAQFLELAQQKGLVRLMRDERAGGLRVDLPQTVQEEAPRRRAPPPSDLSEGASRLQGVLAEAALEIGDPGERRIVIEQFVSVCQERARRNRTCALQFVLGDLLRRVKQEAPEIPPRTVKGVAHALRRANLLIHPNGDPAKATTAPFVAPTSASALLAALDSAALSTLRTHGEEPAPELLTELFGEIPADRPAPAEAAPAERAEGEPAEELPPEADAAPEAAPEAAAEEAPVRVPKPRRRKPKAEAAEPTEATAAEAAPPAAEAAPAAEASSDEGAAEGAAEGDEPAEGAEGDDASPERKRRRRGGRRGRKPAAGATEE